MPKLSNEEANYLKLIIFINTIATPAVRVKFNQHFPPTSLPTTLKNEESKLRSMRVLNAMQLSLLYPATGAPLSENFDISLMVCLLRNLTHIVSPSNGFDKLPANNEIHDGADLARIKHYRNYLFHGNRSTIPTQQFNDIWTDLTAISTREKISSDLSRVKGKQTLINAVNTRKDDV
ncbi:unnamed protein product [Mytilus coruscus]|uniref:DZIP3-like HEPN domain-containing protein n=1 Tax=Mytilus coruscus TaxID=42192 RepID=A0A6J8A0X9_MYTCO|nr:unnamed protein product [Mytilus coruscus]